MELEEITIMVGGEKEQIMARKIKVADWLETYVNKDVNVNLWQITERRTGRSLGTGATQIEAKAQALANIEKVGKEKLLLMIKKNDIGMQ